MDQWDFGCRLVSDNAVEFVEATLPLEQHDALQEHLESCPTCQEYIAAVEAGVDVLNRIDPRGLVMGASTGHSMLEAKPTSEPIEDTTPAKKHHRWLSALCKIALVFSAGLAAPPLWKHISWYESQPKRIERVSDGSAAYLLNERDEVIKRWRAEAARGLNCHDLIDDADGTVRFAILGFDQTTGNRHRSRLIVYDVSSDLNKGAWSAAVEKDEIPPDLLSRPGRSYAGDQFGVSFLGHADVFTDIAGDEIIVVFQHCTYSQCCVRIYSLMGELLFQCWHDGNVFDVHWLSGSKQLICMAVNGEVDAINRGLIGARRFHPYVIFAVLPTAAEIAPKWVNTTDHVGGIEPAWYQCLLRPPATNFVNEAGVCEASAESDPAYNCNVTLGVNTPFGLAGMRMHLDSAGREVPGTRVLNGLYERALNDKATPDPTQMEWGDLPAIQTMPDGLWLPGIPRRQR